MTIVFVETQYFASPGDYTSIRERRKVLRLYGLKFLHRFGYMRQMVLAMPGVQAQRSFKGYGLARFGIGEGAVPFIFSKAFQ